VLASGRKIRDRLVEETGLSRDQVSIVGYPKFDITLAGAQLPMLANGRPTVLYNPHVSPHLSSWYDQGRQVLDYFLQSSEYNLIFAPHVMLFERPFAVSIDRLRLARPGRLDPRLYAASHIHIDLGTPACTDMTYTTAADVYLGDVSSQVYEFLRRPRPCVFLNPQGYCHEGDPNFAHWAAGPVIRDVSGLDRALRTARERHGEYRPAQQRLFDYSFDLTAEPSSARAARAIREVVSQRVGVLA
jgi:CDP-glycerol glycerophosphotransferase (TagB/SpsB family)